MPIPMTPLLLLAALAVQGAADDPAQSIGFDFTGRWEGAILVRPGEYEIDLRLILERCESGGLCGQLTLPAEDGGSLTLDELKAEGRVLRIRSRDSEGTVSQFHGTASPDGQTIEGVLTEGNRQAPFSLSRASGPPPGPREVKALAENAEELREQFTRDRDKVRLLMILSPT